MKQLRWRLLVSMGLMVAMSIATVSAQTPGDTTLVAAVPDSVNNDPAVAANSSSFNVVLNAYEGLTRFAYGGLKLEPGLAEKWTVSPTGRIYTFTLRQGVKFHDGSPLTAGDVKYSFDRAKAKASAVAYLLEDYKASRVVDDRTIQIEMSKTDAPFLEAISHLLIIGQQCMSGKNTGTDLGTGYLQEHDCGTGPFQIDSWQRGQQLVLKKFDDYWGKWPVKHLDRVVLRVVPEIATALLLLQRGDIDIQQYISLDDLPKIAGNSQIRLEDHPGLPAIYLQMRYDRGPTKDVRVREALSYSFPYQAFLTSVMQGHAQQLQGPLARELACHDSSLPVLKQDFGKAKELLQQAGYGQGLKITMVNLPFIQERRQMALLWQSELKKIGVDLDYKELALGAWYALLASRENGPDTFILGDYPAYPDADSYLWRFFQGEQVNGGLNYSFYQSPAFDTLLAQGRAALDPAARCDAYKRAQRMLVSQYAAIWVMQQNSTELQRNRVKNYRPFITNYGDYYFYPLYKEGP